MALLKTQPPAETLCIDLEAGMKSVQDWPGDSRKHRLLREPLSPRCRKLSGLRSDDCGRSASSSSIRITDLTRQTFAWAHLTALHAFLYGPSRMPVDVACLIGGGNPAADAI